MTLSSLLIFAAAPTSGAGVAGTMRFVHSAAGGLMAAAAVAVATR